MSQDLTAILLQSKGSSLVGATGAPLSGGEPLTPDWIESVVRERGRPVILRIAPLERLGLVQVEVADVTDGLPTEDPDLVSALSKRGAATFLHVNHEAEQAILHGFDAGEAQPSFVGKPDAEFATKLRERLGCDLQALHEADDQSRSGIGIVASRTAAVLPGRNIFLPVGMPSALGSFAFHDRAIGDEGEAERCIFFAFDAALPQALLSMPGAELAKIIETAGEGGQLFLEKEATDALVVQLRALDGKPISEAEAAMRPALVRAVETLVLSSGRIFSAGDRADFWSDRLLPLLSISDSVPKIDADELEELEQSASVLHALVELVPSAAPPGGPGSLIEGIGDAELAPLLPPFASDGQYSGSVLTVAPARLLESLRGLDGEKLSGAVERLQRAWYAAKSGKPADDEGFVEFAKELGERGQTDVDRVLRHLSELRVVLEVAAVNELTVALAFYG